MGTELPNIMVMDAITLATVSVVVQIANIIGAMFAGVHSDIAVVSTKGPHHAGPGILKTISIQRKHHGLLTDGVGVKYVLIVHPKNHAARALVIVLFAKKKLQEKN